MDYLTPLGHGLNVPSRGLNALYLLVFIACALVLGLPAPSSAQFANSSIANTYVVSGGVPEPGDLISFDRSVQEFRLADGVDDANLFGVVVSEPAIVLRSRVGGVSVVTEGEAIVNVTNVNGPVAAGDYISSSAVPGKAQKAAVDASFVLGTALESFSGVASTSVGGGSPGLYTGSIRALLAVGPHKQQAVSTTSASGAVVVDEDVVSVSTPISRLIKYILASLIVFGTIYLAFKNFTANLKDSVVSVGRNPLAKASIQSMVVLNTSLTVVVSAIGLFIGLMVLFLPL
jgi:hypothetical protein